ncbi:hypothetical protein E2C01_078170 [Portunus trituberculatus]|uniref:Uncharacterized protein n=1 Tax=Portunus trituberculatus TaxID=210409 RepID=A0A5B7IN56_PORTR|nr:hypothetical protein [Portunus trituberculatus]
MINKVISSIADTRLNLIIYCTSHKTASLTMKNTCLLPNYPVEEDYCSSLRWSDTPQSPLLHQRARGLILKTRFMENTNSIFEKSVTSRGLK